MRYAIYASLLTTWLVFSPIESSHAGKDVYIGEITIFAGTFAPRGYAFCDGRVLSIRSHTALFSIIGTKYGGDGRTTFRLPDLRRTERLLRGARYIIAIQGIYPSRS